LFGPCLSLKMLEEFTELACFPIATIGEGEIKDTRRGD
jgi:hypothetical protein